MGCMWQISLASGLENEDSHSSDRESPPLQDTIHLVALARINLPPVQIQIYLSSCGFVILVRFVKNSTSAQLVPPEMNHLCSCTRNRCVINPRSIQNLRVHLLSAALVRPTQTAIVNNPSRNPYQITSTRREVSMAGEISSAN